MYFWRTDKLIEDLKQNRVSQNEFKNYYLASSIIVLLGIFASSQIEPEELKISFALFLINLGLLISWTNAIFKANGGAQGHAFLNRIIALYLPIMLKTTAFVIVLYSLILSIFNQFEAHFDKAQFAHIKTLISMAVDVFSSFLVYWRICAAVKKINSPQAAVKS